MVSAGMDRAGHYIPLRGSVRTFLPKALPPDPPLRLSEDYVTALSEAERSLGRLDGIATALPNADLFVYMYVRKEAVLSSQIEGTQSTLVDLLEYEAGAKPGAPVQDVGEVANYVDALNMGLDRLRKGAPLNLALLKDVHRELLEGTRDEGDQPGGFRSEEVWIGYQHCPIEDADFVPPPPVEVPRLLSELEAYMNRRDAVPLLTKAGLLHAQFETIHPFLNGNGRVGRMLISLFLTKERALQRPLLYLSYHFRQRREEYCAKLQSIRDNGDWESWLIFFLNGVAQVSSQATDTAHRIAALRERDRAEILTLMGGRAGKALNLLESLFAKPIVSVEDVRKVTHSTFPTANTLVGALEGLGILREVTGQRHYRRYAYAPYIDILNETESRPQPAPSPAATTMPAGTAQ